MLSPISWWRDRSNCEPIESSTKFSAGALRIRAFQSLKNLLCFAAAATNRWQHFKETSLLSKENDDIRENFFSRLLLNCPHVCFSVLLQIMFAFCFLKTNFKRFLNVLTKYPGGNFTSQHKIPWLAVVAHPKQQIFGLKCSVWGSKHFFFSLT